MAPLLAFMSANKAIASVRAKPRIAYPNSHCKQLLS